MNDEDLVRVLELSPNLVELDVQVDLMCKVPSRALRRLTNDLSDFGQATCLVPNLEIIGLRHHSTFDYLAFLNMVQSRWKLEECISGKGGSTVRVARLKTVRIHCPSCEYNDDGDIVYDGGAINPEAFAEFQELKAGGLEVDIFDLEDTDDDTEEYVYSTDSDDAEGMDNDEEDGMDSD
jgi:hypothetical protein